jgi:hypothetical protein
MFSPLPLCRLSDDETDLEDKLDPTVRYLLALGPKYLTLIFQTSRWVFDVDFDWAMKVRPSLLVLTSDRPLFRCLTYFS